MSISSFQNLTGSHFGDNRRIKVENIIRRVPSVAWQCRCEICDASFVEQHARLVSGALRKCPNAACGRNVPKSAPEPTFTQPSPEAIRANPDAARGYLESIGR